MGSGNGVASLPLTLWLNPHQVRGLGAIPLRCSSPTPGKFSFLRILSAPPAAQGIYLLGSGAWRVVDVVPVEDDLEVLVVHPVAARVWYVQKQMRIRQPVPGADRLLAVLP
jgi:hypothetical protein